MRIRSILLALLLCTTGWTAHAQTVFNSGDKAACLVISGGGLTATGTASGGDDLVRSSTSKSSGKLYFEGTMTLSGSESALGLANSTASLTAFLGTDNNGIGTYKSGHTFLNGSNVLSGPSFANGDTMGVAEDLGSNLYWVRNDNAPATWNLGGSADPVTGVGGQSISAITGPFFVTFDVPCGAGAVATVNFGATSFNQPAPSGFSAWDPTGSAPANGAALTGTIP